MKIYVEIMVIAIQKYLKKVKTFENKSRKKIYQNSFISQADTESLLEKIDPCHSNPIKSSANKLHKHTAPGYSVRTHCSFNFNATKNKHDYEIMRKRFHDKNFLMI